MARAAQRRSCAVHPGHPVPCGLYQSAWLCAYVGCVLLAQRLCAAGGCRGSSYRDERQLRWHLVTICVCSCVATACSSSTAFVVGLVTVWVAGPCVAVGTMHVWALVHGFWRASWLYHGQKLRMGTVGWVGCSMAGRGCPAGADDHGACTWHVAAARCMPVAPCPTAGVKLHLMGRGLTLPSQTPAASVQNGVGVGMCAAVVASVEITLEPCSHERAVGG